MTHSNGASRTLSVTSLARVEGEGSMHVVVRDGVVRDVELRIFEPPRFFEAFLRGRSYTELPDITARICGICPVAYQMSACQAIESACGVRVDDTVRALRRLLYCGEWIESHILHIYLLHAPDFLGYESSIDLARDHRDLVERGLKLKKIGNDILNVLGGRAIHPVNVRVGGFYKAPAVADLEALTDRLSWARDAAISTAQWVAGFEFPDVTLEGDLVSLRNDNEYPILEGRIASTAGLDIAVAEFPDHFTEEHVAHSTALQGHARTGGTYTLGPLARYNLNFAVLPPLVKEVAADVGIAAAAATRFRASSSVPWRWSSPARKRCASSRPTSLPPCRTPRCPCAAAPAMGAPRHREVPSTIATPSTGTASSAMRSSCRRPHRISHRSNRVFGSSSRIVWISMTPS